MILQILEIRARPERRRFRPARFRVQRAFESDQVVGGRLALEPPLPQAELLAIPAARDVRHHPPLEGVHPPPHDPLEGPRLVPTRGNVPPKAYLFKVGRAVPPCQAVSPPLGVSVQLEASLAGVVDGESGTVASGIGAKIRAVHGDPRRSEVDAERLLLGRSQKVTGCFLVGEQTSVAGACKISLHSIIQISPQPCWPFFLAK